MAEPQRKIIHIDMDAFFASVEQRDTPALRGKPVIVGGRPDSRGVVAACSYEARVFGVHSAMPSSRAARLCPDAIFVAPRFEAYKECSELLRSIFAEYTDLIEPLSLDEAFLDVTFCQQHQGSATRIAQQLKRQIHQQLQLTASAGVSYNKFLAKIASDMDKPDGLYVITPQQAEAFIKALPVRKFFGVGKVTEQKMHALNIRTGADLGNFSERQLIDYFGKAGRYYYQIARGVDTRPVRANRRRKSIGKETTFNQDLLDKSQIDSHLERLSGAIGELLCKRSLTAKTLTLKVKYKDFSLITRSVSPPASELRTTEDIRQWLAPLIAKTELGRKPCRLLGISVSQFIETQTTQRQASLF